MTRRNGGWTLDLTCSACGFEDQFHDVLLPLAADYARAEGWEVPGDAAVLILPPAERQQMCPTCVAA